MNSDPLNSIIYVTLPDDYVLPKEAYKIDTTIPLPIQMPTPDIKEFDIKELKWEMVLAGILTVLAYEVDNPNVQYYRSIILASKPNIKAELTEAAILKTRNEDWDIAEEIFTALHGLDPEDMTVILNSALFFDQKAESYRRSGLNEDADAYDDIAFDYYKKAMVAEPAIPDAFFNAAFFYLKQRNYAKGKECFETYLTLTKEMDDNKLSENDKYKRDRAKEIINDICSRNLEDELFKSAYDFIKMEQEEKALEKIREFLQKNPKVWNAWFMLGWALRRLGRWQDGKAAFLQAIECGGENADTLNELAICCKEEGNIEEAREHLMKALSYENENTKILSNLGFLELQEGNPEQARKYFEIVLEIDPNDLLAKEAIKSLI
ncbi:MAG: tetratricopeptide repeat protein [Treponemataceae bacterium]|nr:tetratricopeptide repeat protein [Spirochaetales bacterium]MDY6030702.1 tetratricopeptide repeat protein [Treponemataceae bacterium]